MFLKLPPELLRLIACHTHSLRTCLSLSATCRYMHSIISQGEFLRQFLHFCAADIQVRTVISTRISRFDEIWFGHWSEPTFNAELGIDGARPLYEHDFYCTTSENMGGNAGVGGNETDRCTRRPLLIHWKKPWAHFGDDEDDINVEQQQHPEQQDRMSDLMEQVWLYSFSVSHEGKSRVKVYQVRELNELACLRRVLDDGSQWIMSTEKRGGDFESEIGDETTGQSKRCTICEDQGTGEGHETGRRARTRVQSVDTTIEVLVHELRLTETSTPGTERNPKHALCVAFQSIHVDRYISKNFAVFFANWEDWHQFSFRDGHRLIVTLQNSLGNPSANLAIQNNTTSVSTAMAFRSVNNNNVGQSGPVLTLRRQQPAQQSWWNRVAPSSIENNNAKKEYGIASRVFRHGKVMSMIDFEQLNSWHLRQ